MRLSKQEMKNNNKETKLILNIIIGLNQEFIWQTVFIKKDSKLTKEIRKAHMNDRYYIVP